MIGNSLGRDDAYRFAKGQEVVSTTGLKARLRRPHDFLVVADHSENLGLAPAIFASNPDLLKNAWGKRIHDLIKGGTYEGKVEAYDSWHGAVNKLEDPLADVTSLSRSMWSDITTAAEHHNRPGPFTAFIGYEWTSQPGGDNMHRNVIYRNGKELYSVKGACLRWL
jgi:hypothetical protein